LCRQTKELRAFDIKALRDEFEAFLALATKNSLYPYSSVMIPKVKAVGNLVFQQDFFYASNDDCAAKLLECKVPSIFNLTGIYILTMTCRDP